MAKTTEQGAAAPVAVRVTYADGRTVEAHVQEVPELRYDAAFRPMLGFEVIANEHVNRWLADCIAYGLNEGPDDMESGVLEQADDLAPACTWQLVREG